MSPGLILAVGIIIYISAINDEVGYSAQGRQIEFRYHYGWSFFTICLAFVSAKCSAVLCITHYLMERTSTRVNHKQGIYCLNFSLYLTLRKLPFECQKIAKSFTLKKRRKIVILFPKIASVIFFLNDSFWQLKKVKFLAIF